MRNIKSETGYLRVFTIVSVSFLLLVLAAAALAQSQNWWVLQAGAQLERGKIEEVKMLKKVYVNVTFDNSGTGQITNTTEQQDIRNNVLQAFKAHKGLTVVTNPALAEFAVIVRTTATSAGTETERPANFSVALDPDAEIAVDVTVLIPGAKLPGGLFKSRAVWQVSSPNVQMEAGAGARFAVDGFLWELSKIRGTK
jgi:hypothetical protein